MYNRYIPQPDGSYQRKRVQEPRSSPNPQPQPCTPSEPKQTFPVNPQPCQVQNNTGNGNLSAFFRQFLPGNFETGDLIVVLLLLLMAGDCQENQNNALLTLALYFLM